MNQKDLIKDIMIVVLGITVLVLSYLAFGRFGNRNDSNKISKTEDSHVLPEGSENLDEIVGWNICDADFYFFTIRYPADWKVWKRGLGEAVSASCSDESLKMFIFSPDIYQSSDKLKSLSTEVLDGNYSSLDNYLSLNPQIKNLGIIKKSLVGGEKAVWLNDRVLVYSSYINKVFDIRFLNIDEGLLNKILETISFNDGISFY